MKKLIFLLAIASSLTMFSQTTDEKQSPSGYIVINLGMANPLGDFSDLKVGGASSGFNLNLSNNFVIKKSHFGVATKIDYSSYTMAVSPFLNQQQNRAGVTNFSSDTTSVGNIQGGSYTQASFLFGLYTTIPIKKRLSIDSRILVGFCSTSRPLVKFDITDLNTGNSQTFAEGSGSSNGFSYDFGFGLRYNMGKRHRICLALGVDYMGSNATFEVNSVSFYADNNNVMQYGNNKETISYSVASFNANLGIGFVFGQK